MSSAITIHTPIATIAKCGSKDKIIEWFTAHFISFGITKTSAGGSDVHAKEAACKLLLNIERECVWDGLGGIIGGGHRGPTATGDNVRDLVGYYNDHLSKQSGYEIKEMHKDAWMFLPRSPGPTPYGTFRFGKSATGTLGSAKGTGVREPTSPNTPVPIMGVGIGVGSLLMDGLLAKSDRGEKLNIPGMDEKEKRGRDGRDGGGKIVGTGASHMAAIVAGVPMTGTMSAAAEMSPPVLGVSLPAAAEVDIAAPAAVSRLPSSLRALVASRTPNVNIDTAH